MFPQESLSATRRAGETILREFTAKIGSNYERSRNFDLGPDQRRGVPELSPYVPRRIVLESEVIQAALKAHGTVLNEKFI
jgi:hypothetical protein